MKGWTSSGVEFEPVTGDEGPPGWERVDPLDILITCDVDVELGEQLIRQAFEMGKPVEEIEAVVDGLIAKGRGPIRTVVPPTRRDWRLPIAPCVGRRERRAPRARRVRSSSSSRTSGSDPGDPEGEPPRRRGDLRHVSFALAAYLEQLGGAR